MSNLEVNFNPFKRGGVISRLQYLGIAVFNALLFQVPLQLILMEVEKNPMVNWPYFAILAILPVLAYTSVINIFKRLRDINGKEIENEVKWLWGVGSFLPLVNLILGLRLLFQKGKITSK